MDSREPEVAKPILGLWIFAVTAAHIFAFSFLAQAFLLSHPSLRYSLNQWLRRFKVQWGSKFRQFFCGRARKKEEAGPPDHPVSPRPSPRLDNQHPPTFQAQPCTLPGIAGSHTQANPGPAGDLTHAQAQLGSLSEITKALEVAAADQRSSNSGGLEAEGLGQDDHQQEGEVAATLIDAVLAREPIPASHTLKLSLNPDQSSPSAHRSSDRHPSACSLSREAQTQVLGASCSSISLEWRNLSYFVPTPAGPKALLRGVWGSVCGGEMMALMGASGAGKSTLLELLTLRKLPSTTVLTHTAFPAPSISTNTRSQIHQISPASPQITPVTSQESNCHLSYEVSEGCANTSGGGTYQEAGGEVELGNASGVAIEAKHDPAGAGAMHMHSSGNGGRALGTAPGKGKERGVLLLNGRVARASQMQHASSYIPQDDSLLPQMTVSEVLQMHAALSLPPGTPCHESESRQHMVLVAMGLWHARHTLVGGILPGGLMLRGISGGERKRLAIGAALIPRPRLIFADEPTSGLDAFAALSVMAYLAAMARTPLEQQPSTQSLHTPGQVTPQGNCAVLVSIHQPRAAIWDMFDTVLLLARGRMAYQGSSQGSSMVDWFTKHVPRALTLSINRPHSQPSVQQHHSAHRRAHQGALSGNIHSSMLHGASSSSLTNTTCNSTLGAGRSAPPAVALHYVPERHGTPADWIMDLLTSSSLESEHLIARGLVSLTQVGQGPLASQGSGLQAEPDQVTTGVDLDQRQPSIGLSSRSGSDADGRASLGERGAAGLGGRKCEVHGAHWVDVAADAFASHFLQPQKLLQASYDKFQLCGQQSLGFQKVHTAQRPPQLAHACPDQKSGPVMERLRNMLWQQKWHLRVWRRHYQALVWREGLAVTRNPTDVAGRMLIFVWVSLLGNFLMYGGGNAGEGAGRIRVILGWSFSALFFFMVMPFLFMSVYSADKRTYLADIAAGLYTPGSFYAAKLTTTLPFNILIAFFFTWTGYGMFGFRNAALSLVQLGGPPVDLFATTLAPNQDLAFVLAVAFAVVNLLVTSFFMGPMDPPGWPWLERLRYISALDYAWQERPRLPPANCVVDANVILEYYKIYPHAGTHIGALVAYLAILHILTYASLRWNTARLVSGGQKGSGKRMK